MIFMFLIVIQAVWVHIYPMTVFRQCSYCCILSPTDSSTAYFRSTFHNKKLSQEIAFEVYTLLTIKAYKHKLPE